MKVNHNTLDPASASQLGKAQGAAGIGFGGAGRSVGLRSDSDRVHLSDLSGRLISMLKTESPERAAPVEKLGAEVRAGRYQPDPLEVSRRLIEASIRYEP